MAAGSLTLRFDLRSPSFGAPSTVVYRQMLAQAAWADAHLAVDRVMLSEHHFSPDGYCPSPLVAAAAVGAVTEHARVLVAAIVLPLHDPVRVAEDGAVADLLCGGRLDLVVAAGYRPVELAAFGRDFGDRARLMDEGLAQLRQAWRGEPVHVRGQVVQVTPQPTRPGGPLVLVGGSSRGAALRAARLADGFVPSGGRADLADVYLDERRRLGLEPGTLLANRGPSGVHVTHDVEGTWARLAPHVRHDVMAYRSWAAEQRPDAPTLPEPTLDELRADGSFAVVTPQECIALWESLEPDDALMLHPLIGGLDPELGWESLRTFDAEVRPHLDRHPRAP